MKRRICLFGALSALCLSGCSQNTLPCRLYTPTPEVRNPYWSPAEIKGINTICNNLNAVDSDECVLDHGWDYEAIQLCGPSAMGKRLSSGEIQEVWTQIEAPLRTCGHGPLADSIQDELKQLSQELVSSSPREAEDVYSIHDILDQSSRTRSSDRD